MAGIILKQSASSTIPTPDTDKTAIFVDTDLLPKALDDSGVLMSAGNFAGAPISPAQLVANTDNWNPTGLASAGFIRVSTDATRDLTGIVAPTTARLLWLCNIGAQDLVLKHDATSTAANRFYCPGSGDFTLNANDACRILYDLTSARWRVLAA